MNSHEEQMRSEEARKKRAEEERILADANKKESEVSEDRAEEAEKKA